MEELGGWSSRVGRYGKKGCGVEGKFPVGETGGKVG